LKSFIIIILTLNLSSCGIKWEMDDTSLQSNNNSNNKKITVTHSKKSRETKILDLLPGNLDLRPHVEFKIEGDYKDAVLEKRMILIKSDSGKILRSTSAANLRINGKIAVGITPKYLKIIEAIDNKSITTKVDVESGIARYKLRRF
jgi:hypothetical protein